AHPHRKRPPGLVRHREPRHQPLPHTRSNQLHRRDPPLRPGPPPRTPDSGPHSPLAWLNTAYDFGKPLLRFPRPQQGTYCRRDPVMLPVLVKGRGWALGLPAGDEDTFAALPGPTPPATASGVASSTLKKLRTPPDREVIRFCSDWASRRAT